MTDPILPKTSIPGTGNPSSATPTPQTGTPVAASASSANQSSTTAGQATVTKGLTQEEHPNVTSVIKGILRRGANDHQQMLRNSKLGLKNSLIAALRVLANESLDEEQMYQFATAFLFQATDFHGQPENNPFFNEQKLLAAAHTYAKLYKPGSEWSEVANSLNEKFGRRNQLPIWRILLNVESADPYTTFAKLVSKVNDPKQIAFIKRQIDSLERVTSIESQGKDGKKASDEQFKIVSQEIEDLFTLFSENKNLSPDEFEKVFSAVVKLNQATAFINRQIAIVSELPEDIRWKYCALIEMTSKDHSSRLDEVPEDLKPFQDDKQKALYLSGLRGIINDSKEQNSSYLRRKNQLTSFVKKYPNVPSSTYVTDFFMFVELDDEQYKQFQNFYDIYSESTGGEAPFLPFRIWTALSKNNQIDDDGYKVINTLFDSIPNKGPQEIKVLLEEILAPHS